MGFGTRFLGLVWGLFLFLRFSKIKFRERKRGHRFIDSGGTLVEWSPILYVSENITVASINTSIHCFFCFLLLLLFLFLFCFVFFFNEILIGC